MDTLVEEFLNPQTNADRRTEIVSELDKRDYYTWLKKLEDYVKEQKKQRNLNTYQYMLTFTTDPSKWPDISPERESMIDDLVKQQGLRTGLGITKYSYVKERHQNGRAHWHALIKTSKPLKKDRFNHYITRYGNIDISKSKAQGDANVINYLSKSNDIIDVFPLNPQL